MNEILKDYKLKIEDRRLKIALCRLIIVHCRSKIKHIIITLFITLEISLIAIPQKIYADDIDSTNYKIKDLTVGASGEGDQSSSNYRLLQSIGDDLNDDRFSSTNYKLGVGVAYNWMATAPSIKCFETTSEGSTSCDDADANPDGMVMICGDGGCYDKARFELNSENNPSDTLYSIQITTDAGWGSWDYIDGATFMIENESNHDINDYLTESSWEGTASSINVLGLDQDTTYYLRATALHGDFTESDPGPDANTSTAEPQISFDIDIDGTGGSSSETASPYSIDLGVIELGSVTTATDLIWMDFGTNLGEGAKIFVRDSYSGLYSSSESYTLSSSDADLDSNPGYGLVEYSSSETYLGPLSVESSFGNGGNIVGGISNSIYSEPIYNSSSEPLYGGRCGLYVKARPEEATPHSDDYTDTIIMTVGGDI